MAKRAKSKTHFSPGVYLLGCFKPCDCGSFILHNGNEAALLELPPAWARRRPPWKVANTFLKKNKLNLRYLLVSHAHHDHLGGYYQYRRQFRTQPLVVHHSVIRRCRLYPGDLIFRHQIFELSLDGEPLYIVHAPKHSWEDMLIIFRGSACTGDWTLGRYNDCNNIVPTEVKVETLLQVASFLQSRNYVVHTLYSAHANDFRYNIDFQGMLHEMARYWQSKGKRRRRN